MYGDSDVIKTVTNNGRAKFWLTVMAFVLQLAILLGAFGYSQGQISEKINSLQKDVARNEQAIKRVEDRIIKDGAFRDP